MTSNLKLRIYTSILLFFALFLSYVSNFLLGYFLIIIGVISLLEFFKINKLAFNKQEFKKLCINSFLFLYIFLFCYFILIFSFYLHLKIFIFIILITCIASDIGGFIFGKFFKGPKLTKISPNKTISGAIGSIIFSIFILSFIIKLLTVSFNPQIFVVGLLTSIGCQLGDLFVSFLKRKSSLKDTGKILPGHGGILDRIDGILLGLPVGFFALLVIY